LPASKKDYVRDLLKPRHNKHLMQVFDKHCRNLCLQLFWYTTVHNGNKGD